MQIANYFRANVLHSTNSALKLAMKDKKYISFTEKLISVKRDSTQFKMNKAGFKSKKYLQNAFKINKYDFILESISNIRQKNRVDITSYKNILPRLKIVELKSKDFSEYFIPHGKNTHDFIITGENERTL